MDVHSMESLTSIVSSALEARGVLAKIRAELRANVFAAIHEEEPPDASAAPLVLAAVRGDSAGQVALQLVHELLSACGLDYTASVFLPEAGLDEAIAPSRESLASALGLSAPPKAGEPLLVSLLRSQLGGKNAVAQPGGDDAARPASAPAPHPPLPPLGSLASRYPASAVGGSLSGLPTLPTSRARPGADAPHPPPFAGSRLAGAAAAEEERRLDALETKLAGLAGLQPIAQHTPAGAAAAARGGGERPQSAAAAPEPFADEIDEEFLDDFADDFEEDEEEEPHLSTSRSRFDASVDESVSPGRLDRMAHGWDHSEAVQRPPRTR